MNQEPMVVESMRRVEVQFQAGSARNRNDLLTEPIRVKFIFGVGSTGLTPFEYDLSGRRCGDEIAVHLQRDQAFTYFEHLTGSVLPSLPVQDGYFLQATVTGVQPAESREIVNAMAKATGCGGGCDCGCGC